MIHNLEVGYADVTESTLSYNLKLSDAITKGIQFPEDPASYVRFSFNVSSSQGDSIAYKLFYRNTTYLESDAVDRQFYGGWGYGHEGFHFVGTTNGEPLLVHDSIKIVGNPRNESKYFGSERVNPIPTQKDIDNVIEIINSTPEWRESVLKKSQVRNIPFEDQVLKDAIWVIANRPDEGDSNNRWKRNPRMGNYEFMLVGLSKAEYDSMDLTLKDISISDNLGEYANPFLEFIDRRDAFILSSDFVLDLSTSLDPNKGIFVNRLTAESTTWDTSYMTEQCNSSDTLFENSHWEQFFHSVNGSYYLKNVPFSADVVHGYSRADYEANRVKYPMRERDSTHFDISEAPCNSVKVEGDSAIVMLNPAGRKEPVGVTSRVGMTYGTYTLKVEFPDMLSPDNVWNGVTNAFWMIFDSNKAWNDRSFSDSGYLKIGQLVGEPELRFNEYAYSEIDIEIVKAAEHWPQSSYRDPVPEFDRPEENNDVIVSFTNWDMADRDPEYFVLGAENLETKEGNYWFHRWHKVYNAITCKQGFDHDEIFKRPYYYYQIEWAPDQITWRMGPEKDDLRVFGYMDKHMTSIPDNQMRVVVTQEFHASEWWPTEPFSQDNIPYPINDLKGKVLELTIE